MTTAEAAEAVTDRQDSFAKHVGLSPEQGEILKQTAAKYHQVLRELQDEAERVAGPPSLERSLTPSQKLQLTPLMAKKEGDPCRLDR